MARDLNGWLRPRPVRVAFLIEDGEHAHLTLDGIFADCYGRWGGRFSLIVPCRGGEILPNYWPWLEAYDAEIIYSYVPLTKPAILELHERVFPAQYHYHEPGAHNPRLDVFGFKPRYGFQPLSSLSIVFRFARFSPSRDQSVPVRIIDAWFTETPSRFLTDNFGTYRTSTGNGMFPTDAALSASLLPIVAPEQQVARSAGIPPGLKHDCFSLTHNQPQRRSYDTLRRSAARAAVRWLPRPARNSERSPCAKASSAWRRPARSGSDQDCIAAGRTIWPPLFGSPGG